MSVVAPAAPEASAAAAASPSQSSPAALAPLPGAPVRPPKERPLYKLLSYILPRLEKMDANRFFALPVSDKIAPGKRSLNQRF